MGPTRPIVQRVPGLSLAIKQARSVFDNSPPPVAKVKEVCSYKSTLTIRLYGVHPDKVNFLLLSLQVVRSYLDFPITRKWCANSKNGSHSVRSRRQVTVSGFETGAATARA
jgi:hypothetical protein